MFNARCWTLLNVFTIVDPGFSEELGPQNIFLMTSFKRERGPGSPLPCWILT